MWLMLAGLWAGRAQASEVDLQIVAEDFDLSSDTERSLRRILSRMFRVYEDTLHLTYSNPTPVHVRLVAERENYRKQAAALGLNKPTLGFFSTRLGEGVVWKNTSTAQMRATIVHEASHYLMARGGAVFAPGWLQEGMAEVFETARMSGNAIYLDPATGMQPWLQVHGDRLPPLRTLLTDGAAWRRLPKTPIGDAEYGVGWSICAFLMSSTRGKELLAKFLRIRVPRPAPEFARVADRHWTGGTDELDRAWRRWWSRPLSPLQLPIATTGATQSEPGWKRCPDGSLIREGAGVECPQRH